MNKKIPFMVIFLPALISSLPGPEMDTNYRQVIVVGGGISGLSAGETLKDAGISFALFEAKDRLGGRMYTVKEGDGVLELGAQWIVGGSPANSLFNFANEHKLLGEEVKYFSLAPGYLFKDSGIAIDESIVEKAFGIYVQIVTDINGIFFETKKHNIEDYVDIETVYWALAKEYMELPELAELGERGKQDLVLCLESFETFYAVLLSDDLKNATSSLAGSLIEIPGVDVVVPAGLSSIIEVMEKKISDSIHTNEEVVSIDWSSEKITVKTDKDVYTCDHVIVTIPLGVLKERHPQMFNPPLSQKKVSIIERMGFGTMSKYFLQWNEPWWTSGRGSMLFVHEDENDMDLPLWQRSIPGLWEVEGQPDTLYVVFIGNSSLVADNLPDKEITQAIGSLVRKFTGDLALTDPDRVIRHSWNNDPYSLGTYSYPSMQSGQEDYETLLEPEFVNSSPRVLFAGEHVSPNFWSEMHGARLSGIEQALKIVKYTNEL